MAVLDNLEPGDIIITHKLSVWFNFFELDDSGQKTGYLICNDEEGDTVKIRIEDVVAVDVNQIS